MKSIRRHLLYWLLPGFLALWIGAGTAIFLATRQRLDTELDAELRDLLGAIPFGDRSGRPSLLSIEDFARDDFGIYFQIWDRSGVRILKSENLGQFEIERAGSFSEEPAYGDLLLPRLESRRVDAGRPPRSKLTAPAPAGIVSRAAAGSR